MRSSSFSSPHLEILLILQSLALMLSPPWTHWHLKIISCNTVHNMDRSRLHGPNFIQGYVCKYPIQYRSHNNWVLANTKLTILRQSLLEDNQTKFSYQSSPRKKVLTTFAKKSIQFWALIFTSLLFLYALSNSGRELNFCFPSPRISVFLRVSALYTLALFG